MDFGRLLKSNEAAWIKRLGIWAVIAVIAQGILGGLTVKYFLPVWLSMAHGVLAQMFFLMTIMIAYGLSVERGIRASSPEIYDGGKMHVYSGL